MKHQLGQRLATVLASAFILAAPAKVRADFRYALSFNGTNSFVGTRPIDLRLASGVTLEAWIKPTALTNTTYSEIIRQQGIATDPDWILSFQNKGTILSFGLKTLGVYQELHTAVNPADFVDGAWHHVAATYDGVTKTLYRDGLALASASQSGSISFTGTTNAIATSPMPWPSEFFQGVIDEVRVWSSARSAVQINGSMLTPLTGSEPGLAAYYPFDDGVGTVATDATFQGHPGTLINGPVWVVSGVSSFVAPVVLTAPASALTTNSAALNGTVYLRGTAATAHFDFGVTTNYGNQTPNQAIGSGPGAVPVTAGISGLAMAQSYHYRLVSTDANGTVFGSDRIFFTLGIGGGTALALDGLRSFVTMPAINLSGTNALTLEAWIKPGNLTANAVTDFIRQQGSSYTADWLLVYHNMLSPSLTFGLTTAGNYQELKIPVNPADYADGGWHHIAATYDGTTKKLYADGVLMGTSTQSGNISFNSTTDAIGAFATGGPSEFLNGSIDEVRIWTVARTSAQINQYLNQELTGLEPGLIGYYRFDEGHGTLTSDLSGNGRDGLLLNSPAWVASTAPLLADTRPPSILTQPANFVTDQNTTANFSVTAIGMSPLSYQWRFNGADLPGATNWTLILPNVTTNQAGLYAVQIRNPAGSVLSSNATLTVRMSVTNLFDAFDPAIDASQWSAFGGTVLATNYGGAVSPPNSLWFGGDGSRYATTRPLNTLNGGSIQFWLRIANGSIYPWEMADLPAEGIVLEYSVFGGTNWVEIGRYDTTAYFNWTQVVMSIPAAAQTPATLFRWRQLSNSGASFDHWALDNVSINTAATAPLIAAQPQSRTAIAGDTVPFSVTATGTPPLSYQWRFNGNDIASATNSSLTLTNVQPSSAGSYSVRVSNTLGSITSSNALLKVQVLFAYANNQPLTNPIATFNNPVTIRLQNIYTNGLTFYSLDGSAPTFASTQYSGPFLLTSNAVLRALGYRADFVESALLDPVTIQFSSPIVLAGPVTNAANHHVYYLLATSSWTNAETKAQQLGGHLVTINDAAENQWVFTSFATFPGQSGNLWIGLYRANVAGGFAWASGEALTYTHWAPGEPNNCGGVENRGMMYGTPNTPEVFGFWNDASDAGRSGCDGADLAINGVVELDVPPSIVTQPANSIVGAGSNVTFSVVASGAPPLLYQWRFNGNDIATATNSNLILANVQASSAGNYAVRVSNYLGSVLSSNAALTVNLTSCANPPTGLVSWWRAEGNTLDQAGGNNGTLSGGTTFINGEVGQAFSFNGTNGYLEVPDSPSLRLSNELTIEFWVKRQDLQTVDVIIEKGGDWTGGQQNYEVTLNGPQNNNTLAFAFAGGYRFSSSITDLNWHHCAVVARNGDANPVFYLDGSQQPVVSGGGAATINLYPSTRPLHIGAQIDLQTGWYFYSKTIVDEISMYNRALTASEVLAIYNAGTAGKCASPIRPPIISQPTNQIVGVGDTANFSVIAGGTPPLGYQWRLNGTNLLGAVGNSLVLTNVQTSQAGNYSVTVTNAGGAVTSSNAILTVNLPPTCTAPPVGLVSWWRAQGDATDQVSGNNGTLSGNVTFSSGKVGQCFAFDGNGSMIQLGNPSNLQFQNFSLEAWLKRGSTSQASFNGDGNGIIFGYYNGGYGLLMDPSGFVALTKVGHDLVKASRSITDLSFHHVVVTKSGSTVVFYIDGVAYPAAAYDPGFTFTTPLYIGGAANNYSFFGSVDEFSVYNRPLGAAEVQALYNAASSGKCVVPIAPVIAVQPASQSVTAGTSVTFNVAATGTVPLTYQWYFNGTNIQGASNATLSLTNVLSVQAGNYSVTVTNVAGFVSSSNALLTVIAPPPCASAPQGLVSWWRAQGNASDQVGGNNGSISGNVGFAPGQVGQSFTFDGSGAMVQLGSPTNLHFQDFSIEAWIKRGSTSLTSFNGDGNGIIFGYYNGGYGLLMDPNGYVALTKVGWNLVKVSRAITDLNFHHVVVTKSGSTVVFYIDGVAYPAAAYNPGFTFTTALYIGGAANDYSFFGSVDELSIYSRPLEASEVQTVFNAGSSGKCISATLPVIVAQPTNQTVAAGSSVIFNVSVIGTAPLNFQWYFNGTNIQGALSSTLALTNIQPGQAGNYFVVISNPAGSATSSNALLTVTTLPCFAPPAGLVSWWRAQGDATDQVGGNNGTLSANATFAPGQVGQSFVFDGRGAAVQLGNPTNLQLQNFTIETWIKRGSTSVASFNGNGLGIIFGYNYGGYGLLLSPDGAPALTQIGVYSLFANGSITDLNWHHIAATKSGSTVVYYIDGVAYPAPAYDPGFVFNTPASIGGIGNTYNFYGSVDELSIYNRALSPGEIRSIYTASSSGKCVTPIPPSLNSQPANQTATVGGSATFSVITAGTPPFAYQWSFNGTNVSGATASSLIITNVQRANAGTYAVVVTNAAGSITSSNAVLIVNSPPATVSVVNVTNAIAGAAVSVPVVLLANGNENALSFSLSFDTAKLTFANAALGNGAIGGNLLLNTSQVSAGRLGVLLALPAGTAFPAGTQQLVQISFTTAMLTTNSSVIVSFGDVPTPRQLSDPQANILPASYTGATVSIAAANFEGDVSPRPNGDKSITVTDWVQEGRFAAGLDSPTNSAEFQRADCAPRSSLGDGQITISDWVQVGRYAAGMDPLTPVGGPTTLATTRLSQPGKNDLSPRAVLVSDLSLTAGQSGIALVELVAQGDENALGVTLSFDPAVLTYTGAVLGSGAGAATLNVNPTQIGSGKLGLALALGTGNSFPAGTNELARVSFRAATLGSGSYAFSFANKPVVCEVADPNASTLTASFLNGNITVSPVLALTIALNGQNVILSWPSWATNAVLQVTEDVLPTPASWADMSVTPTLTNGVNSITLPVEGSSRFYRLLSH
jgi:Concanavalin A-like lectin/glucanases superfamily/Immunoglobulin domain/Lectin C-type domain/Chitobiase/beta-hexosaminidase C-terminal domain